MGIWGGILLHVERIGPGTRASIPNRSLWQNPFMGDPALEIGWDSCGYFWAFLRMLTMVLIMHNSIKRLVKLIQISLYAVFANSSLDTVNQTYVNANSWDGMYAMRYLRMRGLTGRLVHSIKAAMPIKSMMALFNSCQLDP